MPENRILEFLTYAGSGGTQHMFLEFMRRASHNDFHFYVCVLLKHDFVNATLSERAIENISLNMRDYWDVRAWVKLYLFVKRRRIDLMRTYGLKAHIIGRLVGRAAGIAVNITSVRSTDPWRKWHHTLLDRVTSGLTDLYISNSEAGRQATHAREKIPLSKIMTIPNGIDMEKYKINGFGNESSLKSYKQTLGLSLSTPVLGIVASFRKMKGHATIVDALPHILARIPDVKCLFVGDEFVKEPSYKQELVAYVRQKGLENTIIFTGPRHDVVPVFAAIDVVVLPSFWEGLPVSLLEAMAMKKPVIASAVGGIPEVVLPGKTGILIPSQDPQALANAAIHLLTHPELASEMGLAGYNRVRQDFSLESVVAMTERVYATLLAQKT